MVSAKANVMIYDDVSKKWNPSGSSPGISKVYIYQNLLNQVYRVVGRKVQDHEVVINCVLSKGMKYQANQSFLQWRDAKQVYGLHFQSKDEADSFAQTMKQAVDTLNRLVSSTTNGNSMNGLHQNGNVLNTQPQQQNGGDNISLGKRSISSEYNNPSIYDENERPVFNLPANNANNLNYNNSSNNLMNLRNQQQQQQHVISPPLSNSSSSSSSTLSSNNGLNVAVSNQNGSNVNLNGYNGQRAQQDYIYNNNNNNNNNQIYNQNTSSSSSSSSSSNQIIQQHQQIPLYQSSPIPPPPPPPLPVNFATNSSFNDNCPQKIYDVIPDTNFNNNVILFKKFKKIPYFS